MSDIKKAIEVLESGAAMYEFFRESAAAVRVVSDLEETRNTLEESVLELTSRLEALSAEHEEARVKGKADMEKALLEFSALSRDKTARLRADLDAQIDEARHEKEIVLSEVSQLYAERDELQANIEKLQAQINSLEARLAWVRNELDGLKARF